MLLGKAVTDLEFTGAAREFFPLYLPTECVPPVTGLAGSLLQYSLDPNGPASGALTGLQLPHLPANGIAKTSEARPGVSAQRTPRIAHKLLKVGINVSFHEILPPYWPNLPRCAGGSELRKCLSHR